MNYALTGINRFFVALAIRKSDFKHHTIDSRDRKTCVCDLGSLPFLTGRRRLPDNYGGGGNIGRKYFWMVNTVRQEKMRCQKKQRFQKLKNKLNSRKYSFNILG